MVKSTFFMIQSPFLTVKTPFFMAKFPFLMVKSTFLTVKSPWIIERSTQFRPEMSWPSPQQDLPRAPHGSWVLHQAVKNGCNLQNSLVISGQNDHNPRVLILNCGDYYHGYLDSRKWWFYGDSKVFYGDKNCDFTNGPWPKKIDDLQF